MYAPTLEADAVAKAHEVSQLPNPFKALFDAQEETALNLRASTAQQRIEKLMRLKAAVEQHYQDILDAGWDDFKRHPAEVELAELMSVILEIKHTCKKLRKWMKPKKVAPTPLTLGNSAEIRYEPRGRCLIISPWNYPVNLTLGPLIPAIAAGNTVIIKVSEVSPAFAKVLRKIVETAFDPKEVALVEGEASAAQHLLDLPFDHVFFTGSTEVGKKVMSAAAKNLTSVTLELGGKSPTIIDSTANLKTAVETIAWMKFMNAGQTCIAPDYIYVEDSVADEVIAMFQANLKRIYGEGQQAMNSQLTRIINARHVARIQGLVDDAKSRGARVVTGGNSVPAEHFVEPTLIDNIPAGSSILQEEIFGPVLPFVRFKTAGEVIKAINAQSKPLAMYIWSKNKQFTEELIANTSAGGTCVNQCGMHFLHDGLPFGGVNHSGMGSYHGEWGMKTFSHQRPIVRSQVHASAIFFPPYTNLTRRIIKLIMKVL